MLLTLKPSLQPLPVGFNGVLGDLNFIHLLSDGCDQAWVMPPIIDSANPQCSLGKSMMEEEAPAHCILRLSSMHAWGFCLLVQ